MINPRQSMIQAICDFRYNVIASYLDEDYIHSDLTKAVFMEKLKEILQWNEVLEGENAISKVKIDVDVREYVNEYKYSDPEFFWMNDAYWQKA